VKRDCTDRNSGAIILLLCRASRACSNARRRRISVGHYEGDTLVIDTVGIKTDRPFAMIDWYGTPYTEALHVVERYRLLDYKAAKEELARNAKENLARWKKPAAPLRSLAVLSDSSCTCQLAASTRRSTTAATTTPSLILSPRLSG
jgi:hypothetical protein